VADLLAAYGDAYGVDPSDRKVAAFGERLRRAAERRGFEIALACDGRDATVGFAFGYPLPEGDTHWWAGLRPEPAEGFKAESGTRTFVLAEIEVRRSFQGGGVGRQLHDLLLGGRKEERATLAVNPGADMAHEIYRRWGWSPAGQVPGSSGDYFDAYDLFVMPLPGEAGRR
jgi:GNAT superfamily N-acetyltransferase